MVSDEHIRPLADAIADHILQRVMRPVALMLLLVVAMVIAALLIGGHSESHEEAVMGEPWTQDLDCRARLTEALREIQADLPTGTWGVQTAIWLHRYTVKIDTLLRECP